MKHVWLPVLALLLGCKTSTVSVDEAPRTEETTDVETEDQHADDASPLTVTPLVARSQIIELVTIAGTSGDACVVEGSVQDLSTRQGLDGATVTLGEGHSATTSGGRFKITGLTTNEYVLSVQLPGYLPLSEPVHLGPGIHLGITIGLAVDSE